MRNIIWGLLLWWLPLQAQGQDVPLGAFAKSVFTDEAGAELPYRLLLPPKYEESVQDYPLVLFLHGAGERGNDNEAQLVHGAQLFQDSLRNYPAIVVFPQCSADGYWVAVEGRGEAWRLPFYKEPAEDLARVMQLVKSLQDTYRVDTARMYLGGLSMGAFATFDLLARWPNAFAAAFAICGGSNPLLAPLYAPYTPLWIFHGDADTVVPVEMSREMYRALEQAGGQARYTEYRGVGHNSWEAAFAEPQFLEWLFAHKR